MEEDLDITICSCTGITKRTIINAIKENHYTTVQSVKSTRAGTVCGGCSTRVYKILQELNNS